VRAGPARLLIAGVGRSGTTWVGRTLGRSPGWSYVHEPDNHHLLPVAALAKQGLGNYPLLAPGDRAPRFEALWRLAWSGWWGTRLGSRAVERVPRLAVGPGLALRALGRVPPRWNAPGVAVKTVYSTLCLEWLAGQRSARVLVVRRSVPGIASSWQKMNWGAAWLSTRPEVVARHARRLDVPVPRKGANRYEHAVWDICLLAALQEEACGRHPDWEVVDFEWLCGDPVGRYTTLLERLGMAMVPEVAAELGADDRQGEGYDLRRVAAEQPESWRHRLSPAEIETCLVAVRQFRLGDWALGTSTP
jgi:hypothetical protein